MQRAKKIWRVLVASPTQALTEMQARVFNAHQAFTALEVNPAPFRHANAYDQRTAYRTSPPEGCALPTSTITKKSPTAADKDFSSR